MQGVACWAASWLVPKQCTAYLVDRAGTLIPKRTLQLGNCGDLKLPCHCRTRYQQRRSPAHSVGLPLSLVVLVNLRRPSLCRNGPDTIWPDLRHGAESGRSNDPENE